MQHHQMDCTLPEPSCMGVPSAHPVSMLARSRQCCPSPVPDTAVGAPLGPEHCLLCSLQLQLEVQGACDKDRMEQPS